MSKKGPEENAEFQSQMEPDNLIMLCIYQEKIDYTEIINPEISVA